MKFVIGLGLALGECSKRNKCKTRISTRQRMQTQYEKAKKERVTVWQVGNLTVISPSQSRSSALFFSKGVGAPRYVGLAPGISFSDSHPHAHKSTRLPRNGNQETREWISVPEGRMVGPESLHRGLRNGL